MGSFAKGLGLLFALLTLNGFTSEVHGQAKLPACTNCAVWNTPQAPLRIYGNTYYVGPHGLSAIFIASDQGHILIDGALPESAPLIAANIRSLGFRIEDVKLIINSHVHFDHAGGIAELERLSGAVVAASPWSAGVLLRGAVAKDDPQNGVIRPIAPVAHVKILRDGEELNVGPTAATAHFTPGHTRGGTSWTWRSCETGRCVNMVYADSISAVSADGFKFTKNTIYPEALTDFAKSFAFLDTVPCDVLITPHPEASNLWARLDKHRAEGTPESIIDGSQCRQLSGRGREQLSERIVSETSH